MLTIYTLSSFCLVFAIVKNIGYAKNNKHLEASAKTVASCLFILAALFCIVNRSQSLFYSLFIIAGLVFGLIGDIYLSSANFIDLKSTTNIFNTIGGASFALGHICYIIALIYNISVFSIFYFLPILLTFTMLFLYLHFSKSITRITTVILLYFFLLSFSLSMAINRYLVLGTTSSLFTLFASFLFFLSDILIGIKNKFYNIHTRSSNTLANKNYISYLIILTYYQAQLLFALSITYI